MFLSHVFAENKGIRTENTDKKWRKAEKAKRPKPLKNQRKNPAADETTGFTFWWTLGDSNP